MLKAELLHLKPEVIEPSPDTGWKRGCPEQSLVNRDSVAPPDKVVCIGDNPLFDRDRHAVPGYEPEKGTFVCTETSTDMPFHDQCHRFRQPELAANPRTLLTVTE
jgi:hypothetical protein